MRDEWSVGYTGQQLCDAATKKEAHHEERRKWWMDKKAEVITKIRAEGINVTESIVDELGKLGYANSTQAYGGPVVQVDAGMAAQVQEATKKVHEHQDKAYKYGAWIQMLSAHPSATFSLDHDDWMFFFGK